jgi:hypothetical protein
MQTVKGAQGLLLVKPILKSYCVSGHHPSYFLIRRYNIPEKAFCLSSGSTYSIGLNRVGST